VWNNLFGKEFELPLSPIPGHKSLIEEPSKPLQFAASTIDRLQRLDLGADLGGSASQSIFHPAQALDREFLKRQWRVGLQRILVIVFCGAEGLSKAKTATRSGSQAGKTRPGEANLIRSVRAAKSV
jgi:hypothetical protein